MPWNQRRLTAQQLPWRAGNRFTLLINGAEIFPVMLGAIAAARHSVFMEMYLVESGRLFERFSAALLSAAQRGVDVYLLFDAFGARKLRDHDRQRLQHPRIRCEYYNPLRFRPLHQNLLRDHRKLLVIDDDVAFVGGVGITDEFDEGLDPQQSWHDVGVQIEGPNVADWRATFNSNWRYWSGQDLGSGAPAAVASSIASTLASTGASTGASTAAAGPGQLGRVVSDTRFGISQIQRDFARHVHGAEHRVWLMTAYFVPPGRLRRALRHAARRGVDVRLLLPGSLSDHPAVRYAGQRYYYSLLEAGVRIFEYQPRFLHGKVLLCDQWVSVGSSNLDRWNLRWSLEANQEIDDAQFAARVAALFEQDFAVSRACDLALWQQRSRLHRLREWFWARIDILLERLGRLLLRWQR